jgi:hypothetical protein
MHPPGSPLATDALVSALLVSRAGNSHDDSGAQLPTGGGAALANIPV